MPSMVAHQRVRFIHEKNDDVWVLGWYTTTIYGHSQAEQRLKMIQLKLFAEVLLVYTPQWLCGLLR